MNRIRPCAMIAAALLLLAGCVQSGFAGSSQAATNGPAAAPQATSAPADANPVSLSSPSQQAAQGIAACAVTQYKAQIKGMAILAHARELPEFVPLTGREPEIQSDAPVFVVQFQGTVRLPLRGGPGSAAYTDIDGPTCVVYGGDATWYLTGPWVDSNGSKGVPGKGALVDKTLPAPVP